MFIEPPSKFEAPPAIILTLVSVAESDLVPPVRANRESVRPNTPDATHVLVDVS